MASSISGIHDLNPQKLSGKVGIQTAAISQRQFLSFPRKQQAKVVFVARENDVVLQLEKDPVRLWSRYVEWLYQNKEVGLYLDVSRVGFSESFVGEMEVMFEKAFDDIK
ncbi:hypothetical protein LIER_04766 [Lithospermum erythrorhizon]|uniref:Uncharacterized protein n=1 Tax=Lithospermum erythrorhizon TaxID=34254 RepID=A0AAV3P214_LITER